MVLIGAYWCLCLNSFSHSLSFLSLFVLCFSGVGFGQRLCQGSFRGYGVQTMGVQLGSASAEVDRPDSFGTLQQDLQVFDFLCAPGHSTVLFSYFGVSGPDLCDLRVC